MAPKRLISGEATNTQTHPINPPITASPHHSLTSPFSSFTIVLNCRLSITRPSSLGRRMPHLDAMARAVFTLSPVTMRTVTPALWHSSIALGTCGGGTVREGGGGGQCTNGYNGTFFSCLVENCCLFVLK
ncbi:hypothetical protein E2C01_043463 [Portunus trituberculatus]|uniref:Uncharacterized protein n=1 Tax=Portunus trituberculatus TaxID=210409 RepID=A0A5B7FZM8_PORTR|nr:hypothetical protein [Portunus trituberculatus]